jgi:hypothetical protein
MATEAYVKQHKMERTIEDMLNSLKSQPGNPYTAMVRKGWPPLSARLAPDRGPPAAALRVWLSCSLAPVCACAPVHAPARVRVRVRMPRAPSDRACAAVPPLLPTAQAKYLADAKLGGKAPAPAAKKPAAAAAAPEEGAADPAFASTEKMLTPSKLGYSGAEFAKPAPVEETYTTAPTGMLTDTPPDTCTGGSSAAASGESAFELIYFPVMAKGLQLAFIAEMSGLPWTGYTSEESGPKSWPEIKDSGVAPFGQMPLLKVTGGITLGQSTAIANYISKLAGPALRGESPTDFAKSQMCMAEGEDIYAALQNCMLQKWKTPEARKEGEEAAAAFFKDGLAKHLGNLEKLATANVNDEGKYSACKFTSVSTRVVFLSIPRVRLAVLELR